jgi:hypothetical protein
MSALPAPRLEPGERLLWEGAPDRAIEFGRKDVPDIAGGLIFAGFSAFWMTGVAKQGGLWAFGAIGIAVGAWLALGRMLWRPFRRSRTRYAITDRRVLAMTDLPGFGPRLRDWRIGRGARIDYDAREPGTITIRETAGRGELVLERLHDAHLAHRLLLQRQEAAA